MTHSYNRKILSWWYCSHCGHVLLNNETANDKVRNPVEQKLKIKNKGTLCYQAARSKRFVGDVNNLSYLLTTVIFAKFVKENVLVVESH